MRSVPTCAIIACGPHGYQGAGRILATQLQLSFEMGVDVVFVGADVPVVSPREVKARFAIEIPANIASAAIGEGAAVRCPDVLLVFRIADAMVRTALQRRATDSIVLWGHYLFPYCAAARIATEQLAQVGVRARLWLTPTGSDVWEITPQLVESAAWIVRESKSSRIVTYSRRFADEVISAFRYKGEVSVLRPAVDLERFRPPSHEERMRARLAFGIPEDAFVMSCHCNMRPVKRPEDVVRVAELVAQRVGRPLVLLMTGPKPTSIAESVGGPGTIIWAGVRLDVVPSLWAADVEVNLSAHDSFNLSLAEALAVGLPCCTTDVVGVAEELAATEACCLVRLRKPTEGVDAAYVAAIAWLSEIATALSESEKWRARCRQIAMERLGLDRLRGELLRLLRGEGSACPG